MPSLIFRLRNVIAGLAVCVLFTAPNLAAQGERMFKGEIKEHICPGQAEPSAKPVAEQAAAACVLASVKDAGKYVLADLESKTIYQLDSQKKTKAFAGKYVFVIGTLDDDSRTIHVHDMKSALSPKVMQAKTVYIDCDNCVRSMIEAPAAAFETLVTWGHFDITSDRSKADLIILFAANPYLGDYVSRDGPDTRPVFISGPFMNVIDPHTGENLWGDSLTMGSWRIAEAARDLMLEFEQQFQLQRIFQASVPTARVAAPEAKQIACADPAK